ncbi:type II toxin-antitoxin system VapC family toxin [Truepera radiovictrix]|uniref:Ribonuclease VapC n=1 Tax=Truepera radiovictrix (strain DSM 17093 / CIP 108686 / LMG 22925 / RQ-24) TaxID=649638 RepID=D7CX07_TRURR|nr:type II toxin-antitoxin system VapC family toxin [Truepera radiovictrix]ADI14515.1 PIN domain protein family protein [Truepera radiovictrix DSM 17093]WMT56933.1 type II toxin-antitoxin system VapC family toxin [Truepera radiovictrix]
MILLDINPLVYAFRPDAPQHPAYVGWLEKLVNQDAAFGLADIVCSGFIRVVTHPRVFSPPSPLDDALEYLEDIRAQPNCVILAPGERHWRIFLQLCHAVGAKGNVVPDAYLAALAIESGSELATADRGVARFPGLRWRHPLDAG